MSVAENKAIFLSYASQDADAARRICEALRAAGVEVWFDQSELRGGDAWDQKIRKQIKDCALFVPVISANTQARLEGYFRLEWHLAERRMQHMHEDAPFLLPVVIDTTRDDAARVPAKFVEVQWTRLPGGETPPAFGERVKKLLGGEAAPVSDRRSGAAPDSHPRHRPMISQKRRPWLIAAILSVVAVAAVMIWRPWQTRESRQPAGGAVMSDVTQLRAKLRPDEWTRADFDAFTPIIDRLMAANPENGGAWALRSIANSLLVIRNLDSGTQPLETGREAADRASRLAPNSPLAELSLGMHLTAMISRGGDVHAPRAPIDRGVSGAPLDTLARYAELTSFWLGYQFDGTEKSARSWLAAEPGASFPAWILAQYNVARRRPKEAVDWGEKSATDPDITGVRSFVTMFEALYYLQADLGGARAMLDRIPVDQRGVNRVVSSRWLLAMAEKNYDGALQELERTPQSMLLDRVYHGPKALLAAFAHEAADRTEVAQEQFQEAERVLRGELAHDRDNQELRSVLALNLACLGRSDDARHELASVEPLLSGQDPSVYSGQVIALIAQTHGVLGEIDRMTPWLRRLFTEPSTLPFTPASLRIDPRFGRYASLAQVQALLTEFAKLDRTKVALAPDAKSVAVLAFANLSDDKGNEYFSDGISEELLNVLAKIPGLKVTARTSTFYFKGKDVPIPEIAQKLGVAYVVEGSVQKSGDRVRITAQLIKAADGFQVWSDQFDRELKDIFAVQDEIAGLIAKNLQLKLAEGRPMAKPVNPEAYNLVLQARFFAQQESAEGRRQAVKLYRQAIAAEAGYALAWAELGRVYAMLGRFYGGLPMGEAMQEARVAVQQALKLNPDEPSGLNALGWVQRLADWDWLGARKSFLRAVELAPDNPTMLGDAAILLCNIGRIDEAITLARRR